jgi:hypothetical protein
MANAITWDAFNEFCNKFAKIIDDVVEESLDEECAINGADVVFKEIPDLLNILGIDYVTRPQKINDTIMRDWNYDGYI